MAKKNSHSEFVLFSLFATFVETQIVSNKIAKSKFYAIKTIERKKRERAIAFSVQ